MDGKKVLVILSGSDTLVLSNNKKIKTGLFLCEMTVPLMMIEKQGYYPVFANPNGNQAAVDPMSDRPMWFGFK